MGRKKYNSMDNIMKLVERVDDRGGGWEREQSKIKLVFYVSIFVSILINKQQHKRGGKGKL